MCEESHDNVGSSAFQRFPSASCVGVGVGATTGTGVWTTCGGGKRRRGGEVVRRLQLSLSHVEVVISSKRHLLSCWGVSREDVEMAFSSATESRFSAHHGFGEHVNVQLSCHLYGIGVCRWFGNLDKSLEAAFGQPLPESGHDNDRHLVSGVGQVCLGCNTSTYQTWGGERRGEEEAETEDGEDGYRGSNRREDPELAKQGGDKVKMAKANIWSDVAKGMKIEDELETTNSN